MSQRNPLEVHGEANIASGGILVIPNRLAFQDLLHVEKLLSGRRILYLIDRRLDYDPLLQAHLEKEDTQGLVFSPDESSLAAFKREIHEAISEGSVILYIPGVAHTRSGQMMTVPSEVLKFLISAGAPVLPLFVDHPEETPLGTERRREIERIVLSFGQPLQREAANFANYSENLLIAAETAFSARPVLKSHLAWEILKGLKKHGRTTEVIDGNDGGHLRFDKLLAAAIVLAKVIREETRQRRIGIILPPGKAGILANLAT
ncbi:MAG: hypothetical protein KGR69_01450, partial [Verrucomicrobia bacterium]|nr:hypothetical protein [Verrucomicrobiota bacterium]